MFWKTARQKRILESSYVECPSCESVGRVSKWNQLARETYGNHSPDIRKSAINKANTFPYQCPQCFKGYSATNLTYLAEKDPTASLKTPETT
ncbi:hypothetical protein CR194_13820 [Salipaludibacillus keqinensis]|uniref:Uncharacterized protein n=1 Tax=Salipaludibacillus keqinensis TaxID=2045207 RepID=A0A323TC52_9BACI|nr:hypothetical protein [Salipaludibacillus keqinensis]PYZ92728.1 hypothetical protein CR194_13820 [Salipaludibacillus keqinensis]